MSETKTKQTTDLTTEPTQVPATATVKRQSNASKIVIIMFLVVGLSLGSGLGGAWLLTNGGQSSSRIVQSDGVDGNKIITSEEQDIASVANKVSPSVVSILTQAQTSSYFGGVQTQQGAGTGIVISSDGYVMTNKHVIQGSQSVTVVTSDGVTRDNVKVVGVDPLNDLAFLKISGVSDLKPAALGDSTSVRIGQGVVAIGNALGQYQGTVTSGVVSGNGRSVVASADGGADSDTETLSDLIQTDAAINPGNSGGPLVNITGQVIGINTAIASEANGLGFSIPIGAAKGMIKTLLETGKVQRSYLGVNYVTITPEVATRYKLPVQSGAYIRGTGSSSAVASGGPADRAGVKDGDIITKVNTTDVGKAGSIASLIGEYTPDEKVNLTILRDGKTETITVTLAAYKNER